MVELSREKLIEIAEQAIVPVNKWANRDTHHAQTQLGECLVLLKAGCNFKIDKIELTTIWVKIFHPCFHTFECDGEYLEESDYYLPTEARLQAAKSRDWY